jgi:hypothetical protein
MDLWKIPCEIVKEFCGLVNTFATKFCLIFE